MRRVIFIIAAMVSLGIPALAVSTSMGHRHTKPVKCPPTTNDVVLAADARSIIYKFPISAEMVPPYIFGCAAGAVRSYKLGRVIEGSASGSVGTGPFALAGPVVAYGVGESHTSGINFNESSNEIVVRNLANGKIALKVPNGSPAEPGDVGLGETTAIVVKQDGAVAWINRASGELGSIQVRSVDVTGNHLLAASPEIEPDSLALAGSILYWTEGSKPFSAALN